MFHVCGVIGLVWVLAWFVLLAEEPGREPPGATAAVPEARPAARREAIPRARPLLRVPAGALVLWHFATTWSLYVLWSWLPSCFRDVQGLGSANAGFVSTAPWLSMLAVSCAAVALSDRLILCGTSATAARKRVQCSGRVVSAAFLLVVEHVHSAPLALAFGFCFDARPLVA